MTHKFASILAVASTIFLLPSTATAKNWYLGGSIGYNQASNQTSTGENRLVEAEFDAGIVSTSVLGAKLDNNFRIEGEFAWRRNDGKNLSFNGIDRSIAAKGAETYGLLFNVFYDFDLGTGFTPYVGGGVGVDFITNEFLYGPVVFEDSDTVLAWQAMAGFSVPVTETIDAFIDARYHTAIGPNFTRTSPADTGVSLDSEYDTFSISVGWRFNLK